MFLESQNLLVILVLEGCEIAEVQSAGHKKTPARNYIYASVQDYAMSDKFPLAILKAFIPQPQNKQQTTDFHMFTYTLHL
jgi:hypothetical protein